MGREIHTWVLQLWETSGVSPLGQDLHKFRLQPKGAFGAHTDVIQTREQEKGGGTSLQFFTVRVVDNSPKLF